MTTLAQLVARTAERLSMAAGTGVQTYAEDRIAEMIQHKFDVEFDKRFWPQFSTWTTYTLDGTLGVVTADLTEVIKRFEDIAIIYPTNSDTPITHTTPMSMNPNNIGGTSVRHYESYVATSVAKVFRVWPRASTGTLEIYYRTKPDTFVSTDTVNFDEQLLILGAVWDYLEDDGTNPNASAKMKDLYDERSIQIGNSLDRMPISLDPAAGRPATFAFTALA